MKETQSIFKVGNPIVQSNTSVFQGFKWKSQYNVEFESQLLNIGFLIEVTVSVVKDGNKMFTMAFQH